MAARRVAMCPTLTVLETIVQRADLYRRTSRLAMRVAEVLPVHRENVKAARLLDVRVIAGTDAGMPGVPFDSLSLELDLLQQVGMSKLDVLRAATSSAAAVLRRPDLGRVTAGAAADLLVLGGNPLDDLSFLRSPLMVFSAGRLVIDRR